MTTSIGLMVLTFFSVAGGVYLLRGSRGKRLDGWQIIVAMGIGIVFLFLVWMAMMVLVVGPSMRAV
jgi:hypothetical protein